VVLNIVSRVIFWWWTTLHERDCSLTV